MALITRYGSLFGEIPQTTGRMYFVAPAASYTVDGRAYAASDGNDGLHPERAVLTVQRGIDLCTADVGDTVVLLAGTHTQTATINVNKAGITIWGVAASEHTFNRHAGANSDNARAVVDMTGTSDELLNITVAGVELGFLVLRGTSAFSCFSFQTTDAMDGLYFHDLVVDQSLGVPSLDTRGIDFGNRRGGVGHARLTLGSQEPVGRATAYLERVTVINRGANGEGVHLATGHFWVKDCKIDNRGGTWASPFVWATSAVGQAEQVIFVNAGTLSSGMTSAGQTGTGVTIINCRFASATSDIYGLASATAITSYEPTSGGTLSVVG